MALIRSIKSFGRSVILSSPLSGKLTPFLASRKAFSSSCEALQAIKLRSYQEDCIQCCIQEIEHGFRRIAVSLPTGGGKTVIFSNLIERVQPRNGHGDGSLILVHRKELAIQAASMCKKVYPERKVEIEMQNLKYDNTKPPDIVIASVQTLIGRLDKYDPRQFKLLITDECHHGVADSYRKIYSHFGITEESSSIASIGFSATLRREDDKSLHKVFDKVVYHMTLEDMINNKHLSDAKFTTVRLEHSDLSKVGTRLGDFVLSGLSKEVNKLENNETVLRTFLHFQEQFNIKSTLLFGVDIQHVKDLNELFNERGVSSRCVTSKTKKQDRDDYVKQFKEGKITVLMNCGIFTEGTDIPNIDCILMVRPTKSETLLVQMIGRGLRLHKSKDICHIIDFVGINNSSIVSVPVLKNLPSDFEVNGLTLGQIEQIKDVLEQKKKQEAQEKEKDELKRQNSIQEILSSNMRDSSELELRTYNTLSDFIKTRDGIKSDFEYLNGSEYSWLPGPSYNVWVAPLSYNSKRNDHLRLEIHPKGLTKKFQDEDVDVSQVYKDINKLKTISKAPETKDTKLYTLTYHKERDQFLNRSNFYQKRFTNLLISPVSTDIRTTLSQSRSFLSTASSSSFLKLTKKASWRSKKPTEKQNIFLLSLVGRALKNDFSEEVIRSLEEKLKTDPKMDAGHVSDILAIYGIFKIQGIRKVFERRIKNYGLSKTAT